MESSSVNKASLLSQSFTSEGLTLPRLQAIECLKKVVAENPVSLSKAELTCLAATLAIDSEIFKDANIGDQVSFINIL